MKVIYTTKELNSLLKLTVRGFTLAGKTYPVQSLSEFRALLIEEGWQFHLTTEGEIAVFEIPEQKALAVFSVLDKYLKPIVSACVAMQSLVELLLGQFGQLNKELKDLLS